MLLNSLDPDVAERPQDLMICGAAGKAAADWDCFHSIVASLRQLEGDESLVVESGRPAGVFRTNTLSPRVVVTSTAGREGAGDWLYAGTQTALPGTYEFFGTVARKHFAGTLAGRLVIAGGMGGTGGAQPLAATLNGAAFLGIDPDAERIKRRVKTGYCEALVNDLDEALRILKNAVRKRAAASVGLIGNCADVIPELARRGVVPDLLTDQTPAHEPFDGYIPQGLTPEAAADLRNKDAGAYRQRALHSIASHVAGMRDLEKLGARVIVGGNGIVGDDRQHGSGVEHTFSNPGEYLRPLLEEGRRPTVWLALSGEPNDIARADRLALEMFSDDERLERWIALARKYIRFQGLPARVAWLRERDRSELALGLNDLVARGEITAAVLIGRGFPSPEPAGAAPSHRAPTPGGSEAAKALLRALPGTTSGTCWVLIRGGNAAGDPRPHTAQAVVADGTTEARERMAH